jgi:hypothetical protein
MQVAFGDHQVSMWTADVAARTMGAVTNTPPEGDEFGSDPHSVSRNDPEAQAQKAAFLSPNGVLIDTCGGAPCYGGSYTGPPTP